MIVRCVADKCKKVCKRRDEIDKTGNDFVQWSIPGRVIKLNVKEVGKGGESKSRWEDRADTFELKRGKRIGRFGGEEGDC